MLGALPVDEEQVPGQFEHGNWGRVLLCLNKVIIMARKI
jgi:hypothetical protein